MKKDILKTAKASKKNWSIYLLECFDGTFYCGITNKTPAERAAVHNTGRGAKYTRGRRPVKLIASRRRLTRSQALKLEHLVKKQRRDKKVASLKKTKL